MASRKSQFSKKERHIKIQALLRDNVLISIRDIRVLLEDVDDGDDDTALLLQDLEDLAGLEQQYGTTRKVNRRVKDTTPARRQQSLLKQSKPQNAYNHNDQKNVSKSRNPVDRRSTSCKVPLPHPSGCIPHQRLILNTKTTNNTQPSACSKPSLPPIRTTSGCHQNSRLGPHCHGNNVNQCERLVPAKFDGEKSNHTRSRENKTTKKKLTTRLPSIASARNVTSSCVYNDDITSNIGVVTEKVVNGNRRLVPPNTVKKTRPRKLKPLIQPDFVF